MRSIPATTAARPADRSFSTPWRPSACSASWRSAASAPARRGRSPQSLTGGRLLVQHELTLPAARVSGKGRLFAHNEEVLTHE